MFLWTGSEPGPPAHRGKDRLMGPHAEVPRDMTAGRGRGRPGRKVLYDTTDAHTHTLTMKLRETMRRPKNIEISKNYHLIKRNQF